MSESFFGVEPRRTLESAQGKLSQKTGIRLCVLGVARLTISPSGWSICLSRGWRRFDSRPAHQNPAVGTEGAVFHTSHKTHEIPTLPCLDSYLVEGRHTDRRSPTNEFKRRGKTDSLKEGRKGNKLRKNGEKNGGGVN